MRASEVIRLLDLEPLPEEGGFFRRTYSSRHSTAWPSGPRLLATAIYYLVTPDDFSALHRLDQDEMFHFYLGDAVEMWQLREDGKTIRTVLGPDLKGRQLPQYLASGGIWQGTRLLKGGQWALLGTTVVPGFDEVDFELASRGKLLKRYPQHAAKICRFTRAAK